MSFLFGNSGNQPSPAPKPLGVDERRISSNEQARPVPYMAGKLRMPVTFISDVFDVRTEAVTRDVGKQKTKAGFNYFASFAVLIGHGPFDGIHAIILNGEAVWTGELLRDINNPDYVDITLAGFGLARLYWGTETQIADGYLRSGSGIKHPAYRGQAYIVFYRHFFGFNQTSVQNIEVVVSRYPTIPMLSPYEIVNDDVNPLVPVLEWFQNPRIGVGVADDYFDAAGLLATAATLSNEGVGVSPWLVRAQECRQLLLKTLEYCGGYTRTLSSGQFTIGLERSAADPGALPVVNETMMTKKLEMTPEDWSMTHGETRVKFTNATDWQEDAKTYRDRGNFQITGELNPQTIDRSWITNPNLAQTMANAVGRVAALPATTGQISLRRIPALYDALPPGALFQINYTPRNYSGMVCRVTERNLSNPARPEFTITYKVDRSYVFAAVPGSSGAVGAPPDPEETAPVAVPQITTARVVELPLALCPEGILSLAVLPIRPSVKTVSCKIHLGQSYDFAGEVLPPESYEVLASNNKFAIHGTVQANYVAVTPTIDNAIGISVLLDGVDALMEEQTEFDGLANDLLAFVGDEILSVLQVVVEGPSLYRLYCVRNRYHTPRQAHAAAAEVFIINRSSLQALQHPGFRYGNTVNLKLQPYSGNAAAELSGAFIWESDIAGAIYSRTAPINLRVNDDAMHPAYGTGAGIQIDLTLTESGRDYFQPGLYQTTTVLEFLDGSLAVLGTQTLAAGVASLTLSHAALVAILGSEISFTLRAKSRITGELFTIDSDPVDLFVTKV